MLIEIQEYKVWRGLDPDKTQWSGLNIVYTDLEEAFDMVEYLQRNGPTRIFRVHKAKLPPQ